MRIETEYECDRLLKARGQDQGQCQNPGSSQGPQGSSSSNLGPPPHVTGHGLGSQEPFLLLISVSSQEGNDDMSQRESKSEEL
eukprot:7414095-Karenia_brevis.AAC.1